MRWVNDTKARYYEAHVLLDLFGDWSLVTVWGGLGSRRGRVVRTSLASCEDGLKRLQDLDKRRRHRGYQPVAENVQAP